jgi:hypothetical protein
MFWLGPGWQFDSNRGTGVFDFLTELSTRLRDARINLWGANEQPFYDARRNPIPTLHPMFKAYWDDVTPGTVDLGYLQLHVLAAQSGGGLLETSSDLAGLIARHVEQASCFYSLTFDPPRTNTVNDYHRLEVEIGKPEMTAHTQTGYFDQPVFYDQPRDNTKRLTVAQLEQWLLGATAASSDRNQASLISTVELTERLSSARLAKIEAALKGKKARQALVALADQSAFLGPPADEISSRPPPDPAMQRLIISRTVEYLSKTIPKLPDFFATRTTVQYHEHPPKPGQTWKTALGDRSLYPIETSKASVHFRSGKEVVEGEVVKEKGRTRGNRMMLDTVGTFGPILAAVLGGATSPGSELFWSHWEEGPNGTQAVFRYLVPKETSLFLVGSDYLTNSDTVIPFERPARFHGEIAIDPANGAVLRLSMQADLEPRLPLERSDVMVEYGPVAVAGNTYICPAKAVSISRQRRIMDIHQWGEDFKVYAPFETLLSDMEYTKYHKFHATSRILPGYIPAPEQK